MYLNENRFNTLTNVLKKRQENICVVLENVEDPRNVSAVMRTCDAVGIQNLYLLQTKAPRAKKYGFKSGRSSHKWITLHNYTDASNCFSHLKQHYASIYSTKLSPDSVSLFDLDLTQNIALLFGSENEGVTDETLTLSDGHFVIPQVGFVPSLNISVACAITIYEAYRQKLLAGHYENCALTVNSYQNLFLQWSKKD